MVLNKSLFTLLLVYCLACTMCSAVSMPANGMRERAGIMATDCVESQAHTHSHSLAVTVILHSGLCTRTLSNLHHPSQVSTLPKCAFSDRDVLILVFLSSVPLIPSSTLPSFRAGSHLISTSRQPSACSPPLKLVRMCAYVVCHACCSLKSPSPSHYSSSPPSHPSAAARSLVRPPRR